MTDNDLHYDPAYDEFLLARKRELLRELDVYRTMSGMTISVPS